MTDLVSAPTILTPAIEKIITIKNTKSIVSYLEIEIKLSYKREKKSLEPFRICLLNSTANPAQFVWKMAGLAVLYSWQLLNGSHDLFSIFYFFR